MDRIQIIKELAQYAHPSWYHQILNWPTKALEKLLHYYQNNILVHIGIDWGTEDITVFVVEKVGEPLKHKMILHGR